MEPIGFFGLRIYQFNCLLFWSLGTASVHGCFPGLLYPKLELECAILLSACKEVKIQAKKDKWWMSPPRLKTYVVWDELHSFSTTYSPKNK